MEPELENPEISGFIDARGDSDTFELLLDPGTQYRITVRGEVGLNLFSDNTRAPLSVVEEAFQNLLTTSVDIGNGFSSTFVAQPGARYFAEVETFFNSFFAPIPYTLEIEQITDDVLAGVQTQAVARIGETFQGTYETLRDQDWVGLDVTAGDSYLASVTAAFGDSMFLVGYDSQTGAQVDLPFAGQDDAFRTTSQVGFTAQAGVDYFAVLQDNGGFGTNDYTFSLTSVIGDTAASNASTTLSVDPGAIATGLIDGIGDYDWVRLNTTAGDSYSVTAQGPGGVGGRRYTFIEVDNATGEVVDTVDPLNTGLYTFSACAGSSYFVEVVPSAIGIYEVGLTRFDDDFPDNTTTTGVLSVDNPVTATRGASTDYDIVRLDVQAGQSYLVSSPLEGFRILRGDTINLDSSHSSASVGIFDDPTAEESYQNFTTSQQEARVDVETGFEYYLVISPVVFGSATFTLTEVASETLDNAGTNVTIAPNQTIAGIYDGRTDQDWIRLDVETGQSAQITISNAREMHIFAVAADGSSRLLSNQEFINASGTTAQTVVTGRAGETLYLQVGIGVTAQTYSVAMVPIADDFGDDPATAVMVGSVGPVPTSGPDLLEGTDGVDLIDALAGDDTVLGFGGNDTLDGGAGNDVLNGGAGDDSISGGANFDTISAGEGNDTVRGDDGRDLVFLNQGDDLYIDNAQGGELGRDTVFTGLGNDTVEGGNGDDVFYGEDGNDVINGRLGNDLIFGGNNFDTISAGDGNDTVDGGNGRDLVFLNQGDDLYIDNAQGGELGRDTVFTGLGNDTVEGGNGDDVFYGEDGNDVINGRLGNDTIFGGNNFDTISAGDGNDEVHGGNGRDLIFLNQGDDIYFDNAQGGELGRDTVFAGFGDDTIEGGNGDDLFLGEDGDDVIFARLGNDTLEGGAGQDTLNGGDGADTFVFNVADFNNTLGFDIIEDFVVGSDVIQMGGITQGDVQIFRSTSGDTANIVVNNNTSIRLLGDDGDFTGLSFEDFVFI